MILISSFSKGGMLLMKIKVNSEKNVNYNQSSVDSCSHTLKSN